MTTVRSHWHLDGEPCSDDHCRLAHVHTPCPESTDWETPLVIALDCELGYGHPGNHRNTVEWS